MEFIAIFRNCMIFNYTSSYGLRRWVYKTKLPDLQKSGSFIGRKLRVYSKFEFPYLVMTLMLDFGLEPTLPQTLV